MAHLPVLHSIIMHHFLPISTVICTFMTFVTCQNELNYLKKYLPGYPFPVNATYPSTSCQKLDACGPNNHTEMKFKQNLTTIVVNGCGPRSVDIPVPQFDFGACCNMHDYCYSLCNSHLTFEECNGAFSACMQDVCNGKNSLEREFCNAAARVYSQATTTDVACTAFRNNATNICKCA